MEQKTDIQPQRIMRVQLVTAWQLGFQEPKAIIA
jgi:hypothetical protein